jgi:hypothetical protein
MLPFHAYVLSKESEHSPKRTNDLKISFRRKKGSVFTLKKDQFRP